MATLLLQLEAPLLEKKTNNFNPFSRHENANLLCLLWALNMGLTNKRAPVP